MYIIAIALGGCLKGPPVEFGVTEDTGGHITYVLGAATALSQRPDVHKVEIVTRLIDDPLLGPAYAVPFEPLSSKLNIRRIDSGNRDYLTKEANAADRAAFRDALIAYIDALVVKPDLVHAHFADAGDVAMAIRDRFGISFVYTAHSLGIDKASTGSKDHALAGRIAEESRVIAAADGIVASSRDEAERQLMLYPGACPTRIHCLPPGAALNASVAHDPAAARRLIAPFLRAPERPMILAIARPVAKKNLAGLVHMFGADERLRQRANLVIVAGLRDGPQSGEMEQRGVVASLLAALDEHDLYGALALPKRHSQSDIQSLYALARETGGLFVNPALTEPYGLTLTEAAMHGLPVVATCHGGPADIVERLDHGRIADPHDPAAFTAAMHALLDDRAAWARASDNGRRNAARLDWDSYAARFVKLARNIVRPRTPVVWTKPERASSLLLCDIDNTLTGCRAGVRDFARFLSQRPGLAFGVATGRSLQEAQRLLAEWKQPAPRLFITSVGSEIYWREKGMLRADVGYAAHIANGWDVKLIESRLALITGLKRQAPLEQRRHKASYFVSEPSILAAVREAVDDLPVRVIHSHGHLLDILPERAGKGAAMAWAARAMGISRKQVFAAGDSGNDLDMLSACHNPILVANHSEEVRDLAHSPTIYVSNRPHAGGIVEGMRAFSVRTAA
ncbi:MAG: HAD-IIB family hydrolase [Sphingobium sp.]